MLEEKKISSKMLVEGSFLNFKRDVVELPDGKQTYREYVAHPGAVMIIPILPNGDIVLERQYRYPVNELIIEFPAGKIDPNEDGFACAQRELYEETGYKAENWAYMGKISLCVGYSDEIIHVWLAKDLQAGQAQPDDGEFVEVFTATVPELKQWVLEGKVTDSKTMAGLHWLLAYTRHELDVKWASRNYSNETIKDS